MRVERRVCATVAVVAALLAAGWPASARGAFETELVSRQSLSVGGFAADGPSQAPAISADGRYVAFESTAENLSAEDEPGWDVFVRDMRTGQTSLVSRATGVHGAAGDGVSTRPVISADGRFVAFRSYADNLSDADVPGLQDVYVRDLANSVTTLVSRASASAGGAGADGESIVWDISADGRRVAFTSAAHNLYAPVVGILNVFVRDIQTNETIFVSRATGTFGDSADGASLEAAISENGRYVAFATAANNLSTADPGGGGLDVYLRDLETDTTTYVSRRSARGGGQGGNAASYAPDVSADGRYVVFESGASNLSDEDLALIDVFLRDTQAATTSLVSTGGEQDSMNPVISADARHVAFQSDADDLSPDDVALVDVFSRDLAAGLTRLVSRRSASEGDVGADASSQDAAISSDGRYVAFDSFADNLSAIDSDGVADVFLRDVLGPAPQPMPPAPGPAPAATPRGTADVLRDVTAPDITRLSLTNRTFAVARASTPRAAKVARGTKIRITLSERATVRFEMRRALAGRLVGSRCVKPSRANRGRRRCARYRTTGAVERRLAERASTVTFTGRIARRALPLGRYQLRAVARDATGNRSRPRTATFTIVAAVRRP